MKVLEGKLDEGGKTDEEKYDLFKHTTENLEFCNEDHEKYKLIRKKIRKKRLSLLIAMLVMMVKVIIFHTSYVS